MNVGEAAVHILDQYGVRHVFGIPGVHTFEFYRGLAKSDIAAITPRHEQGAGFMADAYARISGQPGVCVLITGPGVTNAMTPIAQAWHDSIPLLILASATASADLGRGRGPLHDVPDQAALTGTLTASSQVVTQPDDLPTHLYEAWTRLTQGRPRPVHVAIPTDVLARQVQKPSALPLPASKAPSPDEASLSRATELLEQARMPVILAGGGAIDASSEVISLAEAADAPIVLTGNAKGLVPPDHPLSLGARLPIPPVLDLVEGADVVVCIGTELSDVDTLYAGRTLTLSGSVIRIDIDSDQMHKPIPASVPLHGDAEEIASRLAARISSRPQRDLRSRAADRVAVALAHLQWKPQTRDEHAPWLDALAAAVPAAAIWSLDSTELAYSLHHYVDVSKPRSWLAPYGLGTLGPAIPMAIGAKVAAPDRPVIAVAGDGGALFTIPELATAVDLRCQLTVVIWDNKGYGVIRRHMTAAGIPPIGTDTTAHDLVTTARGLGCHASLVTTPKALHGAVKTSMTGKGVTVIVIQADGAPPDDQQARPQ